MADFNLDTVTMTTLLPTGKQVHRQQSKVRVNIIFTMFSIDTEPTLFRQYIKEHPLSYN